jgi:hypothetical protein
VAGLTLKRYEPTATTSSRRPVWRLRVEASEPAGFDGLPFVFRRLPAGLYGEDPLDDFVGVASAVELADLPPDEPDPDRGYPYLRKAAVELDLKSAADCDTVWRLLRDQVTVLIADLDRLAALGVTEEVRLGDPA